MTILGNIHDSDAGRPVRALATRHRRLAVDFPGWGDPGYASYLLPIPEGLPGAITGVESHGANPWTRYTVRFADGTTASGLVIGTDIAFADGNPRQSTGPGALPRDRGLARHQAGDRR